jgi:hypothetical protein
MFTAIYMELGEAMLGEIGKEGPLWRLEWHTCLILSEFDRIQPSKNSLITSLPQNNASRSKAFKAKARSPARPAR